MQVSETKVKQVMADVFGVPAESITDNASVDTIEKWDSLNHMKLVLVLEAEFGVTLSGAQSVEILSYPLIKSVLAEHRVICG